MNESSPRPVQRVRKKWWNALLYSIMTGIVLALLLLLHLVAVIQDGNNNPLRRREMALKVVPFKIPAGYELTSAVYAIHPRFFVLTQEETGQKIRVMERRWWAKSRTPEEFVRRFGHPGRWIEKPGMGYTKILVEEAGTLQSPSPASPVPYVTGVLSSDSAGAEKGLLACLYNPNSDYSVFLFSSASAEVFCTTEALDLAKQIAASLP